MEAEVLREKVQTVNLLRDELTMFYKCLQERYSTNTVIDTLMYQRQYTDENMRRVLQEVGVVYVEDFEELQKEIDYTQYTTYLSWGLAAPSGKMLLNGRYIFPIRDFNGKVTALVGWGRKEPKYIVTPTLGFIKDAQFFNAESCVDFVKKGEKTVYLVEGIFDALALRSRNFCALGNFGLDLSGIKAEILTRFEKVVIINDADKAGRRVFPYMEGSKKETSKQWHIENTCTYVRLELPYVKDADDLIRYYDCDEDIYNLRKCGAVYTLKADKE